ncbi:hypothetical protein LEP1GSC125_2158 [Leptospira mayottensis 200901122]|uniref:Uncharacterized protein n=2 Tax=Leptospira mayottensis TaxID=1137606 RepID=A0AA87MNR1_9LEPT|nr:hypothetical protein DQM28_12570 [Leptospira mayottensis]EKS00880.1 hypothetical protein LEP1GSC125_2158 [Leptospira mayottensis 200901122]
MVSFRSDFEFYLQRIFQRLIEKTSDITNYKLGFELFFRLIKSTEQNLEERIVFYCPLSGGCNFKTGFEKCVQESGKKDHYTNYEVFSLERNLKGNFEYSFCLSGNRVS